MAILSVENLRKKINGTPILRGVDFSLAKGELGVLLGPNGAGKTLCLNCISGSLARSAGEIWLAGGPVDTARKHRLSLLLQESMLLEQLTGRENIRFYRALHPAAIGRCTDIAEALDLEPALAVRVRDYSGGMKRKLGFAITLGPDVPVYLLDEPTSGLDFTAIATVHELLRAEQERGKCILISSHVPIDLDIADKLMVLRNGSIAVTGSPKTLLNRLPPVVRIRGSLGRLDATVTRFFADSHIIHRGDEARGFLRSETTIEDIQAAANALSGEFEVTLDPPSYGDLFTYYSTLPAGTVGRQ